MRGRKVVDSFQIIFFEKTKHDPNCSPNSVAREQNLADKSSEKISSKILFRCFSRSNFYAFKNFQVLALSLILIFCLMCALRQCSDFVPHSSSGAKLKKRSIISKINIASYPRRRILLFYIFLDGVHRFNSIDLFNLFVCLLLTI